MDTLQKYKEKPLYDVPDSFFQQFEREVMQRVKMEEKERTSSYKKWISAASIAASVVLIGMLSYFLIENRNPNEPFYVHEEIAKPDNPVLHFDSTYVAETKQVIPDKPLESVEKTPSVVPVETNVAVKETIVYRAVDYYIDDYETSLFCETMYDLECYYDY
jgi:hypothetical protein